MSSWGCPHEVDGKYQRVNHISYDMGMKGCVLFGRFRFADLVKNRPKNTPCNQSSDMPATGDGQQ